MKLIHRAAAMLTAAILTGLLTPAMTHADGGREVLVTNTAELTAALADAKAGDEIILREGTYENDKWNGKWAAFFAEASGTAEQPITIRSEDAAHPAVICGIDQSNKIALWITGDYWSIRDLRLCEAQKGLVLDQSCHSVITGCEVYNIGSEGIHLRDDSSYCLIEHCTIHDTGTVTPKYGEGIYIGSAVGTEGYGFDCHYNIVRACDISHVAAECVDIKEFTLGTIVEDCTFDGSAISGENGANSFIEIKGNDVIIRHNTGYRNGCEQQLYGFDLYAPLPEWGQNAAIYENTLYLDSAEVNSVAGWKCAATVFRNTVDPPECAIGSNGNRIMDVLAITCPGDADENGRLNAEDVTTVQGWLHRQAPAYLSMQNADLNADDVLDVFDLALVRRRVLEGSAKPVYTVSFNKEKAGKWRACNGLGSRTVTFDVLAEPGSELNLGYMYWDPYFPNEETGKNGKSIVETIGSFEADADGHVSVTVTLPEDAVSLALEIWDYTKDGQKLDKDTAVLERITAC